MNGLPGAKIAQLALAPSLLVVCEFDGAIAEFVTDPTTARPIGGALETLDALGSLPRTRAAVISGRSLESLCAVCAPAGHSRGSSSVELIGSDGMEIELQLTLGLTTEARRTQRLLQQAAAQIADEYPGVTIDQKPYGVALHVRSAAATDAHHAIDRLLDVARSMPQRIYAQSRRDVLNLSLLPVGQDWAIDALRQSNDATVFYAGNDEQALAALGRLDVGTTVGTLRTGAALVATPTDLAKVLAHLCDERARALIAS